MGERAKKLIVANWKMNPGTLGEALSLFAEARKVAGRAAQVQTVLCPPFLYLPPLAELLRSRRLALGAQDCFYERSGAYTGEISPSQLVALGARFVLLGHSERRGMGESNELVNRKLLAALKEGLVAIVCIGERVRDEQGQFFNLVKQQLEQSLKDIPRRYFLNLAVAYEPLWAISSHATAVESPEDMLQMSIFIRKTLGGICGKDLALKVPILYGGSVDEKNVEGYLSRGAADGVLVGKASLSAESMGRLIKEANNAKND